MSRENKKSKKLMIDKINEVGIEDIVCNTVIEGVGEILFCIELIMKDGNSYHFVQSARTNFSLEETEAIYFGESGDGEYLAKLGRHFTPKKKN